MNTLAIALMIVIALLLAGVIILLIQGRPKADMTAQRLELLERRLAESMYDLRGEQSTLARAARLENQAASDRLSEQIDKRVARLADMTDQNLERIRMTVDERLNQSLEQKFAQVNKCHTAHLSNALYPSGKRYGLAGIGETQLSTSVCSIHIYYSVFILFR